MRRRLWLCGMLLLPVLGALGYAALFARAISPTNQPNVRALAGSVDDPAYADAAAVFDTRNLRGG